MTIDMGEETWMEPCIHYLKIKDILEGEDKSWVRKATCYTLVRNYLFRRGYSQPLLKCVTMEQAEYICETHKEICGYHSGTRTMTNRILRVGYFWPTIWVWIALPTSKNAYLTRNMEISY